ncbi:unnamed protein product [Effrenium voratum]|uniref:Uncharacterized protein n=1 Tax=Effrenium voratum TaxID=2562239 RepID=A0AA36NAF7_9DINO|nr:unnamed protein product [Effrenium voratum]CAJ1396276.1 unnamed protein product [Effrenium voratum]CAJ1423406.1 unnamed protein product [Effrenium voratum]
MALRRAAALPVIFLGAAFTFLGGLTRRALLGVMASNAALPAQALPGSPRFAGKYEDPSSGCLREIAPSGAGVIVRGADGEDCGKTWEAKGRRGRGSPDTLRGDQLQIDFSSKGGPPDVVVTWEPGEISGLRFPEGQFWKRLR